MNPALVTLKIGIILEIAPQPNIALLGVLRLALPTPDEAVVDLKVAFLGGIDIGAEPALLRRLDLRLVHRLRRLQAQPRGRHRDPALLGRQARPGRLDRRLPPELQAGIAT